MSGQSGEEMEGVECVINCSNGKRMQWYYDTDDESDESINYSNFVSFLSDKLNVDAKCLEIYHVETEYSDINRELVEDESDFGCYFEDMDDSTENTTIYFYVQLLQV